jgi:hypothetical protein
VKKPLSPPEAFLRESIKIYVMHLDALEIADQSWVKKCACLFCFTLRKSFPADEIRERVRRLLG